MKPLSHNYRRFTKNPFKKDWVLWATVENGGDGEDIEKILEGGAASNESDLVKSLREMVGSPDGSNRPEIENEWDVLISEYDRWDRYQKWVEEQKNLLELDPDIRAKEGIFLAMQYPVEVPGVSNFKFLHTSFNAILKYQGSEELSENDFKALLKQKMCA
jgi:hypothetical protein